MSNEDKIIQLRKQARTMTEEHKRKIGENKERNRKISDALKGRIFTEEHKEKLSKSGLEYFKKNPLSCERKVSLKKQVEDYYKEHDNPMLGKNQSEQTKKKISEANKGKIGYWKGKHQSKETKNKISKKLKGRYVSIETRNKRSKTLMGHECSEKTKEKLRIARIEYIKQYTGLSICPNLGKYEKKILDEIENRIGYKIIRQFYINGYYLDGYIPELNLVIEIDEGHHYKNGELREIDINRQNNIINSLNCKFFRIKVEDIIKDDGIAIQINKLKVGV